MIYQFLREMSDHIGVRIEVDTRYATKPAMLETNRRQESHTVAVKIGASHRLFLRSFELVPTLDDHARDAAIIEAVEMAINDWRDRRFASPPCSNRGEI